MVAWLESISNSVGMVGVLLLIIAYFLLSTSKMSAQSLQYQLLNLFGAILILFSLIFHFNLSSFVIEVVWVMISLTGIYRILSYKQKTANVSSNVYNMKRGKGKV